MRFSLALFLSRSLWLERSGSGKLQLDSSCSRRRATMRPSSVFMAAARRIWAPGLMRQLRRHSRHMGRHRQRLTSIIDRRRQLPHCRSHRCLPPTCIPVECHREWDCRACHRRPVPRPCSAAITPHRWRHVNVPLPPARAPTARRTTSEAAAVDSAYRRPVRPSILAVRRRGEIMSSRRRLLLTPRRRHRRRQSRWRWRRRRRRRSGVSWRRCLLCRWMRMRTTRSWHWMCKPRS